MDDKECSHVAFSDRIAPWKSHDVNVMAESDVTDTFVVIDQLGKRKKCVTCASITKLRGLRSASSECLHAPENIRKNRGFVLRNVVILVVAVFLGQGTAAASVLVRPGRYTGASYKGSAPKGARHMTIELDVGSHSSASWWVDYVAPCTNRTVETGDPRQTPRLRIRGGRFALRQHVFVKNFGLDMRFQLVGQVAGSGFRGTFRATERQYGKTCATGLLHWTATLGWHF